MSGSPANAALAGGVTHITTITLFLIRMALIQEKVDKRSVSSHHGHEQQRSAAGFDRSADHCRSFAGNEPLCKPLGAFKIVIVYTHRNSCSETGQMSVPSLFSFSTIPDNNIRIQYVCFSVYRRNSAVNRKQSVRQQQRSSAVQRYEKLHLKRFVIGE